MELGMIKGAFTKVFKTIRMMMMLTSMLFSGACNFVTAADKKFDTIDQVPLIPREVVFKNPEKICVRISPDGKLLAYLALHKGAMNIWVKAIGEDNDHPITQSKSSIFEFCWAYNDKNILFIQDSGADECFHIYKVDIKGNCKKKFIDIVS